MTSVSINIEIPSSFSAEKIFKVFSDFDTIAPKVNPEVFKAIETSEGNGGVGTIKIFTFGDAVPFTSGKYKVDAIDASNFSYTYSFFEGDNLMGILDSITNQITIVPSADGGSIFKQTIIYNCKGNEKPSEEVLKIEKDIYEKTFKAIEAYGVAHPDNY
ncbi:root allergen protein-like [Cynara cardunculus var. scolymus]|uniref:Bet v I domain-containing protein n=1 Tax=Cynara cardunculus var. scolymus TaxID=59895 RepID=A0A118JXN8_CYNCS|nr:root allergen protein-like [Cynara cardunculus var. scolymus]KVH96487.1 Bet v I domain-containing protein [Cynara cardunculus var. scolymus]